MAEVLIASAIFLTLMALLAVIFRTTAVQGSSRLSFDASIKNLDAHMEKLIDHTKHSNIHGVASTPWGDGTILSIQRQAGLDSLGSVSWEERLHLYWRKNEGTKLFYADISKAEASTIGLELDSRYPTKPTAAQLESLATARNNKAKILQIGVVEFEVSEGWKTAPEALETRVKVQNAQIPEQTYETEAAIWLEAP